MYILVQEDCTKTGKVTAAGMYFLGFPTYRLDQTLNSVSNLLKSKYLEYLVLKYMLNLSFASFVLGYNQMAAAKDPDTAFFKKLDGFQPCEITELKAGTHVFAVYGKVLSVSALGDSHLFHLPGANRVASPQVKCCVCR